MKKVLSTLLLITISITLIGCGKRYHYDETKINITTTTNIMADLATQIGQDRVSVFSLMGAGVDPHQYIARPNDYNALNKADFILVSGLHLEGKMSTIFDNYEKTTNKVVLSVGNAILKNSSKELTDRLIVNSDFGNNYDPHFWFDIPLYKEGARYVLESLITYEPTSKDYFTTNYNNYLSQLDSLENEVTKLLEVIPINERYLISAHDAFEYFGNEHSFKVYALQGLSTEDQISPSDVKLIVNLVINNNVKAIFPEHSVPNETIKSVSEEVNKKGHQVTIGENLYSDSIGDQDDDNTYIKMYLKNVNTIINAFTRKDSLWKKSILKSAT